MKSLCLLVISVMFSFGCSRSKQPPIQEAFYALEFREGMQRYPTLPGSFTIEQVDNLGPFPQEENPIRYPLIVCTPKCKGLPPGEYVLYSPFAADPSIPEIIMAFCCDKQGEAKLIIPKKLSEQLQAHKITMHPDLPHISLFANPGFCSDWYVLGHGGILHTTFTYQPIKVRSQDGKELIITKKEPGGNLLEVFFNGFSPNSKVSCISNSEGRVLSHMITTNSLGSASLVLAPTIQGKEKGTVKFLVNLGKEQLTAACEWDASTLRIKRQQPNSSFREIQLARRVP